MGIRATFIISLLLGTSASFASEGVKVSGFADAQYHFDRGTPNTFILNQGALYLSKSEGAMEGLIDLPFATDSSSGNNFLFATAQAQAFVKYKYDFGLKWTLGQFDTIYGFELNDTKDVHFARQGIVFAQMPVTHTGLLLDYGFGPVTLMLLVSNSGGKGAQVTARKPEAGVRLSWSNETFSLGAGTLVNGFDGTNADVPTEDLGNEQLIDVTAGAGFGPIRIDAALDMISNKDGKTKVAVGSDTPARDPIMGLLLQLGYAISDKHSVALRYESVSDAELSGGTLNQTIQTKAGLGLKVQMSESMIFKADVFSNSEQLSDAASKETFVDGNIAAIVLF